MLEAKYLAPPSSRALKCSAIEPMVVSAKMPMTIPEMVRKDRSLRRARFRMISMCQGFSSSRFWFAETAYGLVQCAVTPFSSESRGGHDLGMTNSTGQEGDRCHAPVGPGGRRGLVGPRGRRRTLHLDRARPGGPAGLPG